MNVTFPQSKARSLVWCKLEFRVHTATHSHESDADDVIKSIHQLLALNALSNLFPTTSNPIDKSCNSGSKYCSMKSRREEFSKILEKAKLNRRSVKSLELAHCPALHLCIASPLHDPRQATTSTQPPIPSSKLLSLHQHHIPSHTLPSQVPRLTYFWKEQVGWEPDYTLPYEAQPEGELLTVALCAMMYLPQSSSRPFHTK